MSIRFENVGIAVRDLDEAVSFFTDLGLTLIGQDTANGEWADTAVGLDGNHARIAMLQTPAGDGRRRPDRAVRVPASGCDRDRPHPAQ